MVKEIEGFDKQNPSMENKIKNIGSNSQQTIFIPMSFLKDKITPFIPKDYKFKQNSEKKAFPENKNDIEIKQKERKNSSCSENSSTSDEKSPEKQNNQKENYTHKKKGNKAPFKGEAKDFKIKYKTELCKYFEIDGKCKYGDKCAYAHGKENLRSKVTNTTAYRTKKCTQFFENGYCPYGNRCQFAHELKSNIVNNPYEKGMSYSKILEIMSKLENVENIKKLVNKPRLTIFKEICKDEKDNESRLFNDVKKVCKEGLYQRIEPKK